MKRDVVIRDYLIKNRLQESGLIILACQINEILIPVPVSSPRYSDYLYKNKSQGIITSRVKIMDYYQKENPIELIHSPYSIKLIDRTSNNLFIIIDAV